MRLTEHYENLLESIVKDPSRAVSRLPLLGETERRRMPCGRRPLAVSWRPNLSDEGDNHLIELAVAGGAEALVTRNIADFKRAELKFPDLAILTPDQFLEVHPCQP